jgi:hypothetical protein
MNIFLTMDYEVFFGDKSGSVEKCMIEPTNALIELSKKNNFRMTFFWDIGHFIALQKFKSTSHQLQTDFEQIETQIKQLIALGHEVQLHIHPHWEKAIWKNGEWHMNLEKHYKLADFPKAERREIFKKYKAELEVVTGKKSTVFRAGGWCIQPFTDFQELFDEFGVQLDSSVMPGIHWQSDQYDLNFLALETQEPYFFDDDVCTIKVDGRFKEVPISTRFYSPLFFWKLYVLGRLFPAKHKMWGDGNFVSQPGGKKEMLTKGKQHHLSTDGYFAAKLQSSFDNLANTKRENMCVIGHPKSLTKFSLGKLDRFTRDKSNTKRFKTLSEAI